jgi:hypothetical protein
MECPRCGLTNPPSAQRCDCGYDFVTRSVKAAYFRQAPPKAIIKVSVLTVGLDVVAGILALTIGVNPIWILGIAVRSALIYWLYAQVVKKKNWARLALVVIAFPVGLLGGWSREARLYCLQK